MALNLDLISVETLGNAFSVKCLITNSTVRGIMGDNGQLIPTCYTGKVDLFKSLCKFALEFHQAQKVGIVIEHLPVNS